MLIGGSCFSICWFLLFLLRIEIPGCCVGIFSFLVPILLGGVGLKIFSRLLLNIDCWSIYDAIVGMLYWPRALSVMIPMMLKNLIGYFDISRLFIGRSFGRFDSSVSI